MNADAESSFAQARAAAPDGAGQVALTGWRAARAAEHRGLPSCSVGIVISFAGGVSVTFQADGAVASSPAFVAGMHVSPVCIRESGPTHGLQIKLSPRAVRHCFGPAASELTQSITDLHALAGARARELTDDLPELASWRERFALVARFLQASARHPPLRPELDLAWRRLVERSPHTVADVASEVGWSRRHLASQFRAEFGVTPSIAKRIARFERARRALERGIPLAEAALGAGYYDQAHLTHEWSRLALCTPTEWLKERFPSVQDGQPAPREASAKTQRRKGRR